MNLTTGATRETALSEQLREFPRMDNRLLGRRHRYSYLPDIAEEPTLLFSGLTKFDHQTGHEQTYRYPRGWFGGEAVHCPREGSRAEDDAYLLTFVSDRNSEQSEIYLWSARDFGEPICRLGLPQRVPIGYHAHWAPAARG